MSVQIVLDAIKDLHGREQVVTREALSEVTGLKLTIVDNSLKTLVNDHLIVRANRGVFVPTVQHPPARAISKTVLPDGRVKIEVGDVVLELTPKEDRALAGLMSGAGGQLVAIEAGHQITQIAGDMAHRLRRLEAAVSGSGGSDDA